MSRIVKSSLALLAAGLVMAAPFAARARAGARATPGAIGRDSYTGGPRMPRNESGPAGLPFHLLNPHPCVQDTVVLVVLVPFSTPCDSFVGVSVQDPTHVVYHSLVRDSIPCIVMSRLIRQIPLPLGVFPAGPGQIDVEWVIDHLSLSGQLTTEVRHIPIAFEVSAVCGSTGPLPYVDEVRIGPPDAGRPPCIVTGDSIPVVIAGHFPSACFRLVRIEQLPDLRASAVPHPPVVRVIVDDGACRAMPCILEPVPWSASITLAPLPALAADFAGNVYATHPTPYALPVELAQVSCSDSFPPGRLFSAQFPFVVSDTCRPSIAIGCVLPYFGPVGDFFPANPAGAPARCDAMVGPGRPAQLTLWVRSTVALSGFQGELSLSDSALHIARLAPDRGTLTWTPTPNGAKFALVSDHGVLIPPGIGPMLAIDVEQSRPPSPVTFLRLDPYSAVDSAGRPVSCPAAIIPPLVVARICSSSGPALHCDFNGDGREDIRDLVLMVQCLRDSAQCGSTGRFDCNGDGVFNLDDVLCCASRIIGEECAGCPDDTVRGAARIKVAIGPPLGRLSMPDLPLQLEGADLIGGARLSLRYPDDRYDVLGVDVGGAAASWIHLSQASGGRVRIGLIDPAAGPGSLTQASVTLHLALKPGRVAGGEVAIEGADFSARDGVKLAAAVPALRQPLGASPGLQLSANQPNPFAGSTRFVVTLERSGPVEVAVFDLGGRRLATLQRGVLSAGTHEFTWDGRIADGSRARDGVYFYRVASGSETLARKLVLLRSP